MFENKAITTTVKHTKYSLNKDTGGKYGAFLKQALECTAFQNTHTKLGNIGTLRAFFNTSFL